MVGIWHHDRPFTQDGARFPYVQYSHGNPNRGFGSIVVHPLIDNKLMSDDCIFCKIIAGDISSFKVYEDDATLAFMDINPVHDGHVLVIPKEHSANLMEVPPAALSATSTTAQKVAKAVQKTLNPPGMNLLQCNGEAAKQSVLHFHMHILPRQMDDGATLNWELIPGDMDKIGDLAKQIAGNLS